MLLASFPRLPLFHRCVFRVASVCMFGFYASACFAWETDQYTLPEKPLLDVGPEVNRYVMTKLQLAIGQVNEAKMRFPSELAVLKAHPLAKRNFVMSVNPRFRHRSRKSELNSLKKDIAKREAALENFSTDQQVAAHISAVIGRPIAVQEKVDAILGWPTTFSPEWAERDDHVDTYFRPSKTGHVYALAGFHRGIHAAYFILSSTINMYGAEIGMDKLGHFFNEGLGYYEQYAAAVERGLSHDEAVSAAVKWGVDSEAGRFGLIVSGIYSNGDLAANIAGLHFYINLLKPLVLADKRYGPILEKRDGLYFLAADNFGATENLMQRFFSEHMNEALNPSRLEYLQYVAIGSAIKGRCAAWLARWPERDSRWYAEMRNSLAQWNGREYGHDSENNPLISQLCFQ